MWRASCLLLLTLFTFDSRRDRGALAEPVRDNAWLPGQDVDQGHGKETRGRAESARDENSAELIGKWRINGEALEPRWRNGDLVPLLPFSQFSREYRDGIDDDEETTDDYAPRAMRHRQNDGRDTSAVRSRKNPRPSYEDYEDYDPTEASRGYREREEVLPRKRNRPWTGQNAATIEVHGNKKEERNTDFGEDVKRTSYRDAFQVRPNDYEHELNDEEYLKPRPRKRRPPQNYEFALAENETNPWSKSVDQESPPETATKNSRYLQGNATELKSLLKMQQEEGLSLSEILQRRNLTLNDLLKGKADVINALKMKDVEESEDYIEEAARMMSNSFAKLTTTRRPQWTVVGEIEKTKPLKDNEETELSIIPENGVSRKNHTNTEGSSASVEHNDEMYSVVENATSGILILASVDPARGNNAEITTSMPVAADSMELLQADEAAVKSQNSGEINADSLDEDEIMEFSDFTDYKKGRNGVPPVWLMLKEGQVKDSSLVKDSKGHSDDKGSTLSIEKILSPTERSKSENLLRNKSDTGEQNSGNVQEFANKGQGVILTHGKGDYSPPNEKEYQDDTPRVYYNQEHSTPNNSYTDESDTRQSIMRDVESALDTVVHDTNTTMESQETYSEDQRLEVNNNHGPTSHQTANKTDKKSYDDVISEVEPEARAEIFELIASGSAGKRLERLLKSRNMSLEELIALRQRGSSKVHLAEVSRIRTQKPNKDDRVENTNNLNITTMMTPNEMIASNLGRAIDHREENYNNEFKSYSFQPTENVNSSNSYSVNIMQPGDTRTEQLPPNSQSEINNDYPENDEKIDDKENRRTVEIIDLLTTFDSLPIARDIRKEFADQYNENQRNLAPHSDNFGVIFVNTDAESANINDTSTIIQSGFVKEIMRQEPNSISIQRTETIERNNILDRDENNTEKGKALSKVKPSIIASGAILGVTLVVFLAIFIICRIRQKQKYRYRNTFSRAVFQGPVMAARKLSNSSSLSTTMVNVVATSTAKRPERNDVREPAGEFDSKSDIDNDSLDANDSWETIPDYMK